MPMAAWTRKRSRPSSLSWSLGLDYVKGSRMIGGGSSVDLTRFRRFGNWMFRTLMNFLHRTSYTDLCYGYFGFRRGTVDRLDLRSSGFEIETEISIKAHYAGLRTAEIPSIESARHNGADRKSTRLNSSHRTISYAVFCLK